MSSAATTVRQALTTTLTSTFGDLAFVGGVRNDRMHPALGLDGNYCSVFPNYQEPADGQENDHITVVTVQLYLLWVKDVDPAQSADPAVIEAVANRFFRAVYTASHPYAGNEYVWYYKVTGLDYVPDPTGNITRFESTVEARGENPSQLGTAP